MTTLITSFTTQVFDALWNSLISHQQDFADVPPWSPQEWRQHLGVDASNFTPPKTINDYLEHDCPFWQGKKVKETHLLCLVPTKLSIENFKALILNPGQKPHALINNKDFEWVLITQKITPKTSSLPPQTQDKCLEQKGYRIPKPIEAALAIFAAQRLSDTDLFINREGATRCIGEYNHGSIAVGSNSIGSFESYCNNWDLLHGVAAVKTIDQMQT